MPWRVELADQAARRLRRLPLGDRQRVASALDALERDPRPAGRHVEPMEGTRDAFLRYRVGDHRILYEIFDQARLVFVHHIVQRTDLETWLRRHR